MTKTEKTNLNTYQRANPVTNSTEYLDKLWALIDEADPEIGHICSWEICTKALIMSDKTDRFQKERALQLYGKFRENEGRKNERRETCTTLNTSWFEG